MTQQRDPIAVQAYLGGIEYPASREHIVYKAKLAGADHTVLDALRQLPDKSYQKITDVVAALG